MRRRDFITGVVGSAAAWPLAAHAQPREKLTRIGYLSASSPPDNTLESFLAGMRVLGYGEGRDFVYGITLRSAHVVCTVMPPEPT